MAFENDYRHMLDVLQNKRPRCLPVYEHIISPEIMEKIRRAVRRLHDGGPADLLEFFTHYCRFFQEMTYDTVSFEMTIVDILPDHGAIFRRAARPHPDRR